MQYRNPFRQEDKVFCPLCESQVIEDADDTIVLDDVAFHRHCVNDNIVRCDVCGEDHYKPFTTRMGGKTVCISCRSEVHECAHCGNLFRESEMEEFCGDYYCHECMEAMPVCDECGERTPHTFNFHGQSLCRECYERLAPRGVVGYHTDPLPGSVFHRCEGQSNETLMLGFELECGDASDDSRDECATEILESYSEGEHNFHLEHDGSLPDYGFELVSQPGTLEWHKQFGWDSVFREMVSYGLRSNDAEDCGLHVHFSRKGLKSSRNVLLDYFMMKNSSKFIRLARRRTSYASFDSYKNDIGDRAAVDEEFDEKLQYRDRYVAVNFRNEETIEIRIFRGSLNYETFLATLETVHSLVKWIDSLQEKTVDAFEKIRFHHWKSYVKRHKDMYAELIAYMDKRGV